MSNFKKLKIIQVEDLKEFNKILNDCKLYRELYDPTDKQNFLEQNGSLKWGYEIKVLPTKVVLKCIPGKIPSGKYVQYEFKLDGSKNVEHKSGMECYALLQRMSGSFINSFRDNKEFYDQNGNCKLAPISGKLYINTKYFNQRFEGVYSYDRQSSFSWGMIQDMPDTRVEPKFGKVSKDEIGFATIYENGEINLKMVEEGSIAEWVFPKVKSPFKRFVDYYFELKSKAKDKQERQKYKDILNFAVGFIRRHNPFIHSAIICYSNAYIASKIDENTIYSNVDSIVSLKPRNDLKTGQNVGDFKIEHENEIFAIGKSGYQWNYEVPSVRGKSKEWFKNAYPNGFDILKDTLPTSENGNKYYYDSINMIVKVIKGGGYND